jgi:hypothetical protein
VGPVPMANSRAGASTEATAALAQLFSRITVVPGQPGAYGG